MKAGRSLGSGPFAIQVERFATMLFDEVDEAF